MSGTDSPPRRPSTARATLLVLLGLALLGGVGWRVLRSGGETAPVVTETTPPRDVVAHPVPAVPPKLPAAPEQTASTQPQIQTQTQTETQTKTGPGPAQQATPKAEAAAPLPLPLPLPTVVAVPPPVVQVLKPDTAPESATTSEPTAAKPAPAAAAPAQASAAPAVAAPTAPEKPSFDIVRVGPQGDTVVAGRAEPGAEVSLLDNGRVIGRTRADDSGQFVVLPDRPLPAGGQELTLASRETGKPEVAGEAPVVLVVPRRQAAAAGKPGVAAAETPGPLAVLLPTDSAPRLLQGPVPGKSNGKLGLDVVDYDTRGAIRFAGTGAPGSKVRLYVDDAAIGDAIVDPQGRWGLAPTVAVAVGDHRLRVDGLGTKGQVTARVELPFERAHLATDDGVEALTVVQPKQNLWRIARWAYGKGVRYTVIYAANRDQIRDPNLIYPGQVLTVPIATDAMAPAASTGTAASASKSK